MRSKSEASNLQGSYTPFFPPASPNNAEYLIRTIVFIPNDRWPADQTARDAYIEFMRSRIEVLYDFSEKYFEAELMANEFESRKPNFERDLEGKIVIHPYHGIHNHNYYWGDSDGDFIIGEPEDTEENDVDIFYSINEECFDKPGLDIVAEMQKTIIVVFSDCAEYLDAVVSAENYPGWGGTIGRGLQFQSGENAYGGISHISALMTHYIPDSESGWLTAICDKSINHPQAGGMPVFYMTVGRMLSYQVGIYLHELGHAAGLNHPFEIDRIDPKLAIMGYGWTEGASAVRRTLGLASCSTSMNVTTLYGKLRTVESANLEVSRFFKDQVWTDTVPPSLVVSWPRLGKIWSDDETPQCIYITARDHQSGMHHINITTVDSETISSWYDASDYSKEFFCIDIDSITGMDLFFSNSQGDFFDINGFDNQGFKTTLKPQWYKRRISNDCLIDNLIFVDTNGSDDSPSCPEGSFNNPMQNIYLAMRAIPEHGALVLMPGVYTISTPLTLESRTSLIGFGSPDEIVLDGDFQDIEIIRLGGTSDKLVSNISFRNATTGIKNSIPILGKNCDFVNLIFYNTPYAGIDITNFTSGRVENCTFYNIAGIALKFDGQLIADEGEACGFMIKNNIFMNCQSGVEIINTPQIANPDETLISHNLFFNCDTPISGTGHASELYQGHIHSDPLFIDPASANFHLQGHSPAVWSADEIYLDQGGLTRRSMGALEYELFPGGVSESVWILW